MNLHSVVKYYFVLILFLSAGCIQPKDTNTFFSHTMSECKDRIVVQYDIATFSEENFPAPRLLLRKVPPSKTQKPIEIQNGDRLSGKVALTFDACSTLQPSRFDSAVAEILIAARTPATIFFGGKWVLDRPKDAVFLASIPFFEIGNHSYLHGHLTKVSDDRLYHEILWTQEIIYTVTGRIPSVFRPPYLENNSRVTDAAGRLGLKTICGDLPSGDPHELAGKLRLIDGIRYQVQSGSIIIMHINKGGKHTAEALPDIILLLKNMGYELVTVSQLFD
ncbi:polysaccharide deacetylase family protein [bacterium]|nr:MAG: polysaccharide deacetylase family protein [bacterium]